MNIPLLSGHTLKAKEDLVVDKTWAERQKKDPLGTILYNYSESYTIAVYVAILSPMYIIKVLDLYSYPATSIIM